MQVAAACRTLAAARQDRKQGLVRIAMSHTRPGAVSEPSPGTEAGPGRCFKFTGP